LRGVVHSAGILDAGVLVHQSWERFERVMAAKVAGSWNLHRLTHPLGLDFFVLYSSVAYFLGFAGHGSYAAANAFLDALAHHRRALGLPGLAINWGAWGKVGVATRGNVLERLEAQGMRAIEPDAGLRVLGHLLGGDATQVGVLPIDWSAPGTRTWALRQPHLFGPFLPAAVPQVPAGSPWVEELRGASPARRRLLLRARIQQEVTELLGRRSEGPIDVHQPLREMGLDSLMAVQLRNTVVGLVGRTLPATLLFNYPSVEALVAFLADEVLAVPPTPPPRLSSPANGDATAGSGREQAAALDRCSEEELAALLAEKLRRL
jgi:myxalamid-type polyketide synthase MxaB